MIIVVLSAVVCYVMIMPIAQKWRDSPTYVTIADTNFPIWEVDFPAVTICSNNKVMNGTLNFLWKKHYSNYSRYAFLKALASQVHFDNGPER